MVLGTAACGSSSSESGETSQETDKTQIGIVQMADNGAFTDMREGFIAEMNEKGYDDSNTEFIYKNAQGDASNLNTICQQMVSDGVDLVAAIATPSAQAMVNMKSDIPVVFISVSSPLSAGVVTDMEKPDLNATGTSNPIPVEEIIEFSKKVDTDVKKIRNTLYVRRGKLRKYGRQSEGVYYFKRDGICGNCSNKFIRGSAGCPTALFGMRRCFCSK